MSEFIRFINLLREKRVRFYLEGEELKVDAPKDFFTPDIISKIKLYKNDIKQHLLDASSSASIVVCPIEQDYALSHGQHRMWILSQFRAGSAAYNMSGGLVFEGFLDRTVLDSALNYILSRHESLRTIFRESSEGVRQVILPSEEVLLDVDYVDQTHGSALESEIRRISSIEEEAVFDLTIGPLLRLKLVKIEEGKHILFFTMHHIISDGWSIQVLLKEVIMVYCSLVKGKYPSLPELRIQYKDYTSWQQALLKSHSLKTSLAYWQQQFEGEIPVLDLPCDYVRPAVKTYNGNFLEHWFSRDIIMKLKALCLSEDSTLFMGLLALLNTLFYRYTGQEDIILGSPIAGRDHSELENQIGLYINTLALRTRFSGSDNFRTMLSKTKAVLLDGYVHQSYPFDVLIDTLSLHRDLSRSPLFDVMIILQNQLDIYSVEDLVQIDGLSVRSLSVQKKSTSQFDLSFEFVEQEESLLLRLTYNSDLYEEPTVVRMLSHIEQLLESAVALPYAPISQLDYLSDSEKYQLLNEFNDSEVSYPTDKTLVDLFEEQVDKTPNAVAVVFEGVHLTYRELNAKANQLAHYLRSAYAIKSDDLIGILVDRSERMIVGLLGILKSGGAYVPIDPSYPEERIDYIITNSACKILLTEKDLQLSNEIVQRNSKENLLRINSPSDLAYVIYTSGTTGYPKGTLIEHRNVVRLFKTDQPLYHFKTSDVWTMFHSYCFDFSVWEMYGALLHGGKLIIVSKDTARDPARFVKLLIDEKVTILNQTPSSFYNLIQEELSYQLPSLDLRYVIFGGEALNPSNLKDWRRRYRHTQLVNMYGITETTVHVTYKEITDREIEEGISNIGKAIPTLGCYVLDTKQQLVPVGVYGELYVGGAGVGRGYLNQPELTAARFIDNPFKQGDRLYRSGDKARFLYRGDLQYGGRLDSQVKIRGHRIELGEIEKTLKLYDKIKDAVVAVKEVNHEKELIAYLVMGENIEAFELRFFLQKYLPDYMLPTCYIKIDALPLTSNGKLNHKALPDPEKTGLLSGADYVSPRNEQEEIIILIWEEVLFKKGIGVNHNFFTSGGDSIKAVKVITKINKRFNAGLSVADLYQNQTIYSLSVFLLSALSGHVHDQLQQGLRLINQIEGKIEKEDRIINKIPHLYESIYPITQIEQGMIYSSILRSDEPVYYDQFMFTVYLNKIEEFDLALKKIIARHPILRTKYYIQTYTEPVKIVLNEIDTPVFYEDLSGDTDVQKRDTINKFLKKDLLHDLVFDDQLLWKIQLFRLNLNNEYFIVLSCHHSVLDGWSISVLVKELYDLLLNNNTLPALKYTYKDYCAILLGRQESKKTTAYWKELLRGYSRNKLPFNYKGLKISIEKGMRSKVRIMDSELLRKMQCLSSEHNISLKSICLAAHVYLLHIISSENDVVTGVVTHDRPAIENSDYILGCFLNSIPIRINFSEIKNVLSLLNYVNRYIIESKGNEIHLSEIAKIVDVKATSENPVFDTLFNYTDFDLYNQLDAGAGIRPIESSLNNLGIQYSNEMTNTFWDLEVDKTKDKFSVKIKYTPAYFNESDVGYALNMYERILEEFAKDVNNILIPSNIQTEAEVSKQVYEFNSTETPYNEFKLIHQLFEAQVLKTPDNIALKQYDISMTYSELNEKSNQLARYLVDLGLQREENVGLLVGRSFDMIIGMYAILKAGCAYVPIDPDYPKERQQYIISNSGIIKLVTDQYEFLTDEALSLEVIFISNKEIVKYGVRNIDIRIDSKQLAYTIYTSGSTGKPKGVMIEHHSVINLIEWVNDTFEVNSDDNLLFITSMCFDLSVYDIFGILSVGGRVVIGNKDDVQDVSRLKKILLDESITFWDSVPSTMNYLIGELELYNEIYVHKKLRLVFLSGDWIPVDLPERIKKYFNNVKVVSLGGATECTVWSNYYEIENTDSSWSSIPYGKPIKNNFFYILNEQLYPVPRGVVGELYIGGVGVARGYANDDEKTHQAFKTNPFTDKLGGRFYKTGDLGRMMSDENIEFIGRKDNQVKIRGYRVELGEIESALLRNDKISEAVVLAIKMNDNTHELCSYVVANQAIDKIEIKNYLREILPFYMVPQYYVELDALPLNSNGKIDRKALPVIKNEENQSSIDLPIPQTTLELKVSQIWQSILHTSIIGMTDDLFEMGANSLSVGAFVNRVSKELHLSLTIGEVFSNPTINELSNLLAKKKFSQKVIPPVEHRDSNGYEVSSSQYRLWILSQIDETNLAYNISDVIALEGEVNPVILGKAFHLLINRHEILRTVFREQDNMLYQHIKSCEEYGFNLLVRDIRLDFNQQKYLDENIKTDFNTPFDLFNGPLFRACIYRLSDNKWVFTYMMHHIISDGWSMRVFMQELLLLYNSCMNGITVSNELVPLEIQYKDFSAWQRSRLIEDELIICRKYWIKQFEGKLSVIDFPFSKPRPFIKTYCGERIEKVFDKDVIAEFKKELAKESCTLFMGLLSLVNILIYKYTGQKDIIVGTSISGRENLDLHNQIGFYVNNVGLRNQISESSSYIDLLRQVRSVTLDAHNYQAYPIDELIDQITVERDLSRNPLFDIMVVHQNTENNLSLIDIPSLKISKYDHVKHTSSQFDISFDFFENNENLVLSLEYNTDLFNRIHILNITDSIARLLKDILSDPAREIVHLKCLSDSELLEFKMNDKQNILLKKKIIENDLEL